jgi:hypothetical protein
VTSPPSTAVTRVDLRLQKAIVTGDTNKATAVDSAPSQPATHTEQLGDAWDTLYTVLLPLGAETGSRVHPVRRQNGLGVKLALTSI